MDSLVFTSDSLKSTTMDEPVASKLPIAVSEPEQLGKEESDKEIEVNVEVEKIERPVDLYKVLFLLSTRCSGQLASLLEGYPAFMLINYFNYKVLDKLQFLSHSCSHTRHNSDSDAIFLMGLCSFTGYLLG